MSVRRWFRTAGCLGVLTWRVAANGAEPASPPPAAEIVELPAMFVVDGMGAPEWLHVTFPDGEMLAACSEKEARKFAEDFHRHREMVRALVPPEFRGDFAEPEIVIVFDQSSTHAMPQDVVRAVRSATGGGPKLKLERLPAPGEAPSLLIVTPPMPNLTILGEDIRATTVEFDHDHRGFNGASGLIRLSSDFVRLWLQRRRPAVPAWYLGGVCEILSQTEPEAAAIFFRRLAWSNVHRRTGVAKGGITIDPLALFTTPGEDVPPSQMREWTQHLGLFVRWGIDGDSAAQRDRFHAFVRRASDGPVTAELLHECLALDAAALRAQLDRKAVRATTTLTKLSVPLEAPKESIVVRPAPLAVSARLLAEWHRLAAEHLARDPAVRREFLVQAAAPLRRLYDKGSRDPAVVAALGLLEFEVERHAVAQPLLEDAARAPHVRPAVWRALAAERLAVGLRNPEGAGERLGEAQTDAVLVPAERALAVGSPAPDACLVYAQAWLFGSRTPDEAAFQRLRFAVRCFPEHDQLVRRCAEACARHGRLELARELVRVGIAAASSADARETLELLEVRLEAETPGR